MYYNKSNKAKSQYPFFDFLTFYIKYSRHLVVPAVFYISFLCYLIV